jgi:hypothetical protein
MSDNPMLDVAAMANRISSGSLERIGKIQQETYDRKLKRQQLEQQTVEREAKLAIQAANYEDSINNRALRAEQQAATANATLELNRNKALAAAVEDQAPIIAEKIAVLEMERDMVKAQGGDTSSLDAAIAAERSTLNGLHQQSARAISGLAEPATPIPSTLPEGNTITLPFPEVQNPDQMGFDRYGDETVSPTGTSQKFYGPAGTQDAGKNDPSSEVAPVKIRGLNISDEEKDLLVRVVAAEVGTQVDDDGITMMAETVRNRHLMTGKSFSEILQPNYYETMRGENPAHARIAPDTEVYQKSLAAVERALGGSNVANSATHNYYAPAWTEAAAKRNQADPKNTTKYQKEVFYKKRGEEGFNFNDFVDGEVEINLDVENVNIGRQQMSGGQGVINAGLFPPSARPDGGDNLTLSRPTIVATPIVESEPELVSTFSLEGEDRPVAFSSVRIQDDPVPTGLIINDNPPQITTANPEPKENPLTPDMVKGLSSKYSALPKDAQPIYRQKLKDLITNTNPTVLDEEIINLARLDAEREGSSSVEFRNALPDYIKNTVGEDYAVNKFIQVQAEVKQQRLRDRDIQQTEEEYAKARDSWSSAKQARLKEEAIVDPKAITPGMLDKLIEDEEYHKARLDELDAKRKSFRPAPPQEAEQSAQEPEESPLIKAAKAAATGAIPTIPQPENKMVDSLKSDLVDFGIDPKFLEGFDPEADMSLWGKFTSSIGVNENVNRNITIAKNGYINTKAEQAMNEPDRENRLKSALDYFENNKEKVLAYASTLKDMKINDSNGKVVDLYNPYYSAQSYESDAAMLGEDKRVLAPESALKNNPAILYGIIDSMMNFDTGLKQKIVSQAGKARIREEIRMQSMFGNPMQIPSDK